MVATTRIAFPESVVRLSAGRTKMNMEAQALCFMAGAGSIFAGDKLLTTPNPEYNEDREMFSILGLIPKESFADAPQPETKPDQILIDRKQKEALRQKELEEARVTTDSNKFEPRIIRSVDSL